MSLFWLELEILHHLFFFLFIFPLCFGFNQILAMYEELNYSLLCIFKAFTQLFEKVCAYIIYTADSLLFYLFDVSILHSWGNLCSVFKFYSYVWICLPIQLFNVFLQHRSRRREYFCMSKDLCSAYSFASHPEVHFRPSLTFFAWVSCQPISVIAGVTTANPSTVFEWFCFLILEYSLIQKPEVPTAWKRTKEKWRNKELFVHLKN